LALDRALGAPGVEVGQREQELVAADAPAHVAGPQLAEDHVGGHPERLVPGPVAVGVVELLEVVEVEHHDGDLLPAVAGPLERVVQRVVQPAVVQHAREPGGPEAPRSTRSPGSSASRLAGVLSVHRADYHGPP